MEDWHSFIFIGDPEKVVPMARYMKNQFQFVGVPAPERKRQARELIKQSKQLSGNDLLAMIDYFYKKEEREYQYLAIDLSVANIQRLTQNQLKSLVFYVSCKAWWDSVDSWRKVFGSYVQQHPAEKKVVFGWFHQHPDFWMRRIAILLQLLEKETLEQEMLDQAMSFDCETDEFFIQKAIGWALRSYSKTNPEWVENYLAEHDLSKLAVREARVYLPKG